MFKKKSNIIIFIILLSFFIRFGLFYTKWNNLKHSQANAWASSAIGIYHNGKAEYNNMELIEISSIPNINSGNYLEFYKGIERKPYTIMLPGVSLLLAFLWKIIPIYNYSSYIWFQILLDTLSILLFYIVFKKINKKIAIFVTIFLIFNLAGIKRVLMAGYDFWPQFAILINFIGILYILKKDNNYLFLILGFLNGLTLWIRSLTIFLPFVISIFIFIYFYKKKVKPINISIKLILYLFPVVISMISLGSYRNNISSRSTPIRTVFWHSFFAGVGQFSNPYQIKSSDTSVINWASKLNKDIAKLKNPQADIVYESFLKVQAINFIKKYPHLFIRNTFYRIGIMISPFIYRGGDFIPISLFNLLLPIGIIAFILWFLGMYYLFKHQKLIFWLSATIYFYFFAAFGWFYVVGRVILPFLFINIFVYLFGIKLIITKFKEARPNAPTNSKP